MGRGCCSMMTEGGSKEFRALALGVLNGLGIGIKDKGVHGSLRRSKNRGNLKGVGLQIFNLRKVVMLCCRKWVGDVWHREYHLTSESFTKRKNFWRTSSRWALSDGNAMIQNWELFRRNVL